MNLLKKVLEIIIILSFGLSSVTCTNHLEILFDESMSANIALPDPIPDPIPLQLAWVTTQNNVNPKDGGWRILNQGRQIRFDIQDSKDCGGTNDEIQSGTATATITTGETYEFIPKIEGIGELQDEMYEIMNVKLNGKLIVSSNSTGGDLECKMGPIHMEEYVSPPYILTPGVHKFEIQFTTEDESYHKKAYYKLDLIFKK
jgi:hypothetical protein